MAEWNGVPLGDDFDASLLEKEHIKSMPDVGTLLKRFDDTKRYVDNLRRSTIAPPSPDTEDYSKPESWMEATQKVMKMAPDEIKSAFSVPETPEGYGLEIPEDLAEYKDKIEGRLKVYHEKGLNRTQAKNLLNAELDEARESLKARQEMLSEQKQAFDDEFKGAMEKVKAQTLAAMNTYSQTEGAAEMFDQVLADLTPDKALFLQKWAASVGASLGEEKVAHLNLQQQNAMTKDEMQLKLHKIQSDPLYEKYRRGLNLSVEERQVAQAMHNKVLGIREQMRA